MEFLIKNITGMLIDKNLNIIHFGRLASQLLNYEKDKIKNIKEILIEKDIEKINELVQEISRKKEKIINMELTFIEKSGIIKEMEVSASNILNDNSSLIMLNIFDISLRKRMENTFLESQKRYNIFFENGNDAVFIYQIDEKLKAGNFMEINHQACKITGYSKVELMSMSLEDISSELEMDVVFKLILEKKHIVYESFITKKNKKRVSVEINASLVEFKEQKTILIFVKDITERKKIEEGNKTHLLILKNTLNETVNAIAAMSEQRDPYTAGHQQRVAKLAHRIALGFNLEEKKVEAIRMAGVLHDIGKIAIPGELLTKPGRLSNIEMELIKIHPEKGYEILKDIPFNEPLDKIIQQHHERIDGSGYPYKLLGSETLFEAKIIAVSDVVEAMSSHRPYRPALGLKMALDEIESKSGIIYDKEIVKMCMKVFLEDGFTFE